MLGREHVNNHSEFLQRFVEDKVEEIKSVDISIDSGKQMVQTSYGDTVRNVVKCWLLSRKDDRIRQPDWAGFFDDLLQGYDMDDNGKEQVENDLREAFSAAFEGQMMMLDVVATPDPVEKGWNIGVKVIDNKSHLLMDTTNDVDSQVFVGITGIPNYTNYKPEVPVDHLSGNPEDPTDPRFWGL